MAQSKATTNEAAFKAVKTAPRIIGGTQRLPAGCDVLPSGRAPFNVAATGQMDRLAVGAGLPVDKYLVTLGYDERLGLVSVTPVPLETEAAVRVRRSKGAAVIHLDGLFVEYPHLRQSSRRQCLIDGGTDAEGRPCLIIGLGAAVIKPVRSRGKKGSEPAAQAAAADGAGK